MTMRTTMKVTCNCGHTGGIRLSENDQPYSKPYEDYEPVNLNGKGFISDKHIKIEEVIKRMQLTCPKCSNSINAKDVE